uniref:Tumor necrosis factor, alpha-induced protein-A20 domain, Tumor necrosis factor n=1 Tax=Myoviridae sp. ctAys2 TaxID=2825044 RepID=A0A8S5Q4C7_9CAUD|nr:MAG TPA: Tumor necrosis factor, alpha-induced protein-A20 domain, Tumor necrosis factor [Myoviridae sp. ctAys2]
MSSSKFQRVERKFPLNCRIDSLEVRLIRKNKGCQYFGDPFASVGKSTAVNNLTPITTVPKSTLVKTGVSKIGHSTVYMTDLN